MSNDNASASVIAQTRSELLDYARLYFRPRTATQYHNEGIRAPDFSLNAHCPVPVFFCFDLASVLSLPGVRFSNGGMGSSLSEHGDSLEFFDGIPWRDVYSFGPIYDPDARRRVTTRRMAETLVPTSLHVSESIRMIVCRSLPERQTLISLLPQHIRSRWEPWIGIEREGLFERRWAYVESVTLNDDRVVFEIHLGGWNGVPLPARFEHEDMHGRTLMWHGSITRPRLEIDNRKLSDGLMRLWLNDALAYTGNYETGDVPF